MIRRGKARQQTEMVIVALIIVAGGVSNPPALYPHPILRTITDGVLACVEGGRAEAR
jgi:hypothetical protein